MTPLDDSRPPGTMQAILRRYVSVRSAQLPQSAGFADFGGRGRPRCKIRGRPVVPTNPVRVRSHYRPLLAESPHGPVQPPARPAGPAGRAILVQVQPAPRVPAVQ